MNGRRTQSRETKRNKVQSFENRSASLITTFHECTVIHSQNTLNTHNITCPHFIFQFHHTWNYSKNKQPLIKIYNSCIIFLFPSLTAGINTETGQRPQPRMNVTASSWFVVFVLLWPLIIVNTLLCKVSDFHRKRRPEKTSVFLMHLYWGFQRLVKSDFQWL